MGFSYTRSPITNRTVLCCDLCPSYTKVKKIACPFQWCQATAMCPDCIKKHPASVRRVRHESCKVLSIEYKEKEALRSSLLDRGFYLLRSALLEEYKGPECYTPPQECVRVVFQNKNREQIGFFMSQDTYQKRFELPDLMSPTPDFFQQFETLIPCDPVFNR